MSFTKEEKQIILEAHAKRPDAFKGDIRRCNPDLHRKIMKSGPAGTKFMELCYVIINPKASHICKSTKCKKNTEFVSFELGYKKYCSKECENTMKQVAKEKVAKVIKERTAPKKAVKKKDNNNTETKSE